MKMVKEIEKILFEGLFSKQIFLFYFKLPFKPLELYSFVMLFIAFVSGEKCFKFKMGSWIDFFVKNYFPQFLDNIDSKPGPKSTI